MISAAWRIFVLLIFANISAHATIKLPALFADNMVLQQNEKVAIWGWADPGEEIEIVADWSKKASRTTANEEGNWQLRIQTPIAGGPYTLTFKGKNVVVLNNVFVGEVWLCSGQSNMHFPVGAAEEGGWATGVENFQQEIKNATFPAIRMFTVERKVADEPVEDVEGSWEVCSPQTVGEFSAVAYFFAKKVHEQTGLPIGLINSSWGGTPAEGWTKKAVLEADPEFIPILNRYEEALKVHPEAMKVYREDFEKWKQEAAAAKAKGEKPKGAPREPIGPDHHKSPYKLYNAMIAPLVPYTIQGAIWYQGESNADRAYQYRRLFPAMIKNWRDDWQDDFPFYFVQITPHRSQGPEIREAQFLTMLSVPNTGMAVTTDAGDSLDIHPRNKQVVGERLALWALAKDYGKNDLVYSGPVYKSMQVEGNKIRIHFDHVGRGLVAKGGALREFTLSGENQKFYPANAKIEGNTAVVWSAEIDDPVAVRFAWKKIPEPNLFNEAGFPASPFRTDQWRGETFGKF